MLSDSDTIPLNLPPPSTQSGGADENYIGVLGIGAVIM